MKKMYKKDTSVGIKRLTNSFKHAFSGLSEAYKDEENLFIHTVLAVIVIALAFIFRVTATEWLFLIFAISIVMIAELFNSAIERAVDTATLEMNDFAKTAKDISAAAVLFAAIISTVVGCIIFLPHIFRIF